MASEHHLNLDWINKMEAVLETQDHPARHSITLKALLKSINDYDLVLGADRETRKRARKIILAASKMIIERSQAAYIKKLSAGEGTKIRLKSTAAYAEQLNRVIEPILLHINEKKFARTIIEEFLPRVAEEALFFASNLHIRVIRSSIFSLKPG